MKKSLKDVFREAKAESLLRSIDDIDGLNEPVTVVTKVPESDERFRGKDGYKYNLPHKYDSGKEGIKNLEYQSDNARDDNHDGIDFNIHEVGPGVFHIGTIMEFGLPSEVIEFHTYQLEKILEKDHISEKKSESDRTRALLDMYGDLGIDINDSKSSDFEFDF